MLFAFSAILTRIDGSPGNLSVDTRQVLGLHSGVSQMEALGYFVEHATACNRGYSVGQVLVMEVPSTDSGERIDQQETTQLTAMRLCPAEHIAPLAFASCIVALLVVIPDQPSRKLPRPPVKRSR